MSNITTHVLDTARGMPAAAIKIRLEVRENDTWTEVGRGETDSDGRLKTLLGTRSLEASDYRITFETEAYFAKNGARGFFPEVSIHFRVENAAQHHHVPLLLSPYGFSTYRGS